MVRRDDSERIDLLPDNVHYLLADGDDSGGAISSHRVKLTSSGNGALPHRHDHSTEVFFVIEGQAQVLAGNEVLTISEGDIAVVPAGVPHAFAASPKHTADLLIVITPGLQRFNYFRQLQAIKRGELARDSLLAVQDLYDTHFLESPEWTETRRLVVDRTHHHGS